MYVLNSGVRPDNSVGSLAAAPNQTELVPAKNVENGHVHSKPNNDTVVPPVVHLPIRVADLDEYISSRRSSDCEELRKEYRVSCMLLLCNGFLLFTDVF